MIGLSLHMGWRHVLFANWPVDPAVVRPHLPEALTLDTYDGRAWLSVVPFTNVDVRPLWAPSALGFALPELNLRTYVTHAGQRGVYFHSLDADGLLGVLGARLFHHLPYYYAHICLHESDDCIEFTSERCHPGARPVDFAATYEPTGDPVDQTDDQLARFLVERYRYYTEDPAGAIRYAVIDHEPWPLYGATVSIEENTLFRANGFDHPETEPVHLYSPGVDTDATASRRA